MSAVERLTKVRRRHGEWYGDGEFYVGPPATYPGQDPGESKERYIVRCDVPDLVQALEDAIEVLRPHYEFHLRRSERYERTGSDCVCDACNAMRAIEDALGVER